MMNESLPYSTVTINATISIIKKLYHNSPKMKGGGEGGQRPLEFFQKLIRFGSGIQPLIYCHYSSAKFGQKNLSPLRINISRPEVVSGAIFPSDGVYFWSVEVVFGFLSGPTQARSLPHFIGPLVETWMIWLRLMKMSTQVKTGDAEESADDTTFCSLFCSVIYRPTLS